MADKRRWLLIAILLICLFSFTVHYGVVRTGHFPYTPTSELSEDYSSHVGETTYFWARVTSIQSNQSGRFHVDNYAVELTVIGSTTDLSRGDIVQVYGTIRPEQTINARRVIVSPRPNRLFMFGISGIAALIVVFDLFRFWRLDGQTLTIQRRDNND